MPMLKLFKKLFMNLTSKEYTTIVKECSHYTFLKDKKLLSLLKPPQDLYLEETLLLKSPKKIPKKRKKNLPKLDLEINLFIIKKEDQKNNTTANHVTPITILIEK